MHHSNRHFVVAQLIDLVDHMSADLPFFFLRKARQRTVCALSNRVDDLLDVKLFPAPVLFDNLYRSFRTVNLSIANLCFRNLLFLRHTASIFLFFQNGSVPQLLSYASMHCFPAVTTRTGSRQSARCRFVF